MSLFDIESGHRWYQTLRAAKSDTSARLRCFCEETYNANQAYLDDNFINEFSANTPNRFSELFFIQAFQEAGWQPAPKVLGFDFAFIKDGHQGRLLVEVVTPSPAAALGLDTLESVNGCRGYTIGADDVDLALTRITSGVADKAKIIKEKMDKGGTEATDYKIVAVSGVRLNQEMYCTLYGTGLPPDYARAFLPIGQQVIDLTISKTGTAQIKASSIRNEYSETLRKSDTCSFARGSFLDSTYPSVDAVIYSPILLGGCFTRLGCQVSTLHNPTSDWKENRPILGFQADYFVTSDTDEGFTLKRVAGETYKTCNDFETPD